MSIDPKCWYPVASGADLPQGHVYQTRLDGHSLAIWRAASGQVNIWEDRCPHRGVRFSIGIVEGDELRCQYHAWRFASGSGACTHIPAQPDRKPAAAIRATVWPAVERAGLVWTGLSPEGEPQEIETGMILRAIPIDRSAAVVEEALATAPIAATRLLVHPVMPDRSVIRGVALGDADILAIDALLETLRRSLEASGAC